MIRVFILSLTLLLIQTLPAAEGVVVVQQNEDLADGSKTQTTIQLEPTRAAVEPSVEGRRTSFVYLADQRLVRMIDHDRKVYREITEDQLEQMAGQVNDAMAQARAAMEERLKGMSSEQRAMVEKMMQGRLGAMAGAQPQAASKTVYKRGDGSAEINGRGCDWYEGYRDDAMVAQVCAADWAELDVTPADFAVFLRLGKFFSKLAPGQADRFALGGEDWKSQGRFPGIPLEQTTFSGGKAATKTLLEDCRRENIPDEAFATPEGYQMEQGFGGPR